MRPGVIVSAATTLLAGCVGWTGTSALKTTDASRFASYVSTAPMYFVGPLPAMTYGFNYDARDCYGGKGTLKGVPGLIVGEDALDVVCKQYPGIDLRDYPPATRECFVAEEVVAADGISKHPTGNYIQPWLGNVSTPECAKLVADIQSARKDK